mgnify:CR=1 FL=1
MKTRTAILLVVALLLVGGTTLAQTGGPDLRYTIQAGISAGGSYQLTALHWQVEGSTSGGGYHLLSPISPALQGSGCCCTYLPCVLRHK